MSSLNILILPFIIYSSFSLLGIQKPNDTPDEDVQGAGNKTNIAIGQVMFSTNNTTKGVESQEVQEQYAVTKYLLKISNKHPVTQTFKIIKN